MIPINNILSGIALSTLLVCTSSQAIDTNKDKIACVSDRAKLLALEIDVFDQKPEGWRGVDAKIGCEIVAADLIAEYRSARPEVLNYLMSYLLYFHEAQIRAMNGDYKQASALFEKSRLPSPRYDMWNLYVDASLAFLNNNHSALLKARDSLAALPVEIYDPLPKPMNLDVVDDLLFCFEKTYREAYGVCRQNNKPQK